MAVRTYLADVWSVTDFRDAALGSYAEPQIRNDIRSGVQTLAALSLLLHIAVWILIAKNGGKSVDVYSHIALAVLSLHILVSAHFVDDIRALQVLGMVLLVVSALAIVLLAHTKGDLTIGMMAAIIMLLISVPLVPWALREATIVIGLTIAILTSSIISVPGRFNLDAFWLLQLLVFGSILIVFLLVARNTMVRKHDIRARFELDNARKEMQLLSQKDHLTGAWNRRYLDLHFPAMAEQCREQGKTLHVAVLDIDDFKGINDSYGHQLADVILASLGEIFIRRLGDSGSLIRLGGDEFLILYCGEDLEDLIGKTVADLHNESSASKIVQERRVSLSAGFSSAGPDEPADPKLLYFLADQALYSMKKDRPSPPRSQTSSDVLQHTGSWTL